MFWDAMFVVALAGIRGLGVRSRGLIRGVTMLVKVGLTVRVRGRLRLTRGRLRLTRVCFLELGAYGGLETEVGPHATFDERGGMLNRARGSTGRCKHGHDSTTET